MNKAELIVEIQNKLGKDATKACAERALNAVLEAFKSGVAKDGVVQLVGFGTFSVSERKARKGINPQTGKSIHIAASKTVKFKPSAQFKSIC
ncbi:MAG: HU family DNA-binding protein [Puniceicoccales bacterium]|jgi:nucleoid DNA-binding protein|nr:HU family DNA-binding protein [Puniceicoccales bacterium]